MSDKFDVLIVGFGRNYAPLITDSLVTLLNERGLVMPCDPQLAYSEDVDLEAFAKQLDILVSVMFRESFKDRYEARIERYNRRQPRKSCTLLEWNRKIRWQPRFFSAPSRKQHFSQSRLRLSQVLSSGHRIPGRLRRDSSRGLLSL